MAVAFVARFLNKNQFIDWPPGKKNKAVERGGGSTVFGLKMFTGFNA